MTGFDYAVLGVLGFSLLVGVLRGLVKELVMLSGWIAAYLLSTLFAPLVARYLPQSLGSLAQPLAYLAVFVGVLIIMRPGFQELDRGALLTLAGTPPKVTRPGTAPNEVPEITTGVPTAPAPGDSAVTAGVTTKGLAMPNPLPTDTTTGPDVAPAGTGTPIDRVDHMVGVAGTPLKVTVLVPWEAPKPTPEIVTPPPTAPLGVESTSGTTTRESYRPPETPSTPTCAARTRGRSPRATAGSRSATTTATSPPPCTGASASASAARMIG